MQNWEDRERLMSTREKIASKVNRMAPDQEPPVGVQDIWVDIPKEPDHSAFDECYVLTHDGNTERLMDSFPMRGLAKDLW